MEFNGSPYIFHQ